MKTMLFTSLVILATMATLEASPLKSKTVKELICSRIEAYAWDYSAEVNEKTCITEGSFKVTDKVFNPQIKKYSRLKVNFSYEENKVEVSGTVTAVRVIRFSEAGDLITRWTLENFEGVVDDNRNYVDRFNELFDNNDVNIHNGDAGIVDVKPGHTQADLEASLEEALEDYGDPQTDNEYDFCSYWSDSGIENVIEYMEDHSSEAAYLLETMKKKGEIKGAAYRGYNEGASEYCSNFYFEILTNDNKVIYFYFDFTT